MCLGCLGTSKVLRSADEGTTMLARSFAYSQIEVKMRFIFGPFSLEHFFYFSSLQRIAQCLKMKTKQGTALPDVLSFYRLFSDQIYREKTKKIQFIVFRRKTKKPQVYRQAISDYFFYFAPKNRT